MSKNVQLSAILMILNVLAKKVFLLSYFDQKNKVLELLHLFTEQWQRNHSIVCANAFFLEGFALLSREERSVALKWQYFWIDSRVF